MEAIRGPGGLTIERDLYFRPESFSEAMAQFQRERGQ